MQETQMKQIIAELIESFGEALALITSAIAKNGDADKFHAALQAQILSAKTTQNVPLLAIRLATQALAGIEGERLAKQAHHNQQQH